MTLTRKGWNSLKPITAPEQMSTPIHWNPMKINSIKNVKHGFPIRQRYSAILIVMAPSRNALLR